MSVSFILAFAVENYLDEILELLTKKKNNKNTDNYLYKNYVLTKNMVDRVVCWKSYWGLPRKLDKILD